MTKEERREYYRNWRKKNAERNKERIRKWKEKNAEHVKELSRLNREKKKNNPEYKERRRQYHQEYYQEHRQEYVERQLQYFHDKYHNDPAYRGYYLFYRYKRLDIKKNVTPADPSEYPSQEEVNEMLLQPCVWCGQSDWHKIGLDRKDNNKGHIRGNIQPCCKRCNEKKGKLSNEEFKQRIADGRIKLKAVKIVKTETCDPAVPAMPTMRSLLA